MADLWLTATIQHPPSTTPSKTQDKKKKHKINIHKIDASHNYVRGISSKKGVNILPFNLA
jgi:hypothetical protein